MQWTDRSDRCHLFLLHIVHLRSCLAASKDSSLKVFECYHHYCDVIKCPSKERVFENVLNCHSCLLVNVLCSLKLLVISHAVPNAVNCILVWHLIEDPITAKNQKVVSVSVQFKRCDFRSCDDSKWVTSKALDLCFSISESSWDWKSSWKDSKRSNYFHLLKFLRHIVSSLCSSTRLLIILHLTDKSSRLQEWFFAFHSLQKVCDLCSLHHAVGLHSYHWWDSFILTLK